MLSTLTPCPSCVRHVRTTEKSCPFCMSALPVFALPDAKEPTERLSRAAALAFAASVAITGCTSSNKNAPKPEVLPSKDAGTETGPDMNQAPVPVYGAPAIPVPPPSAVPPPKATPDGGRPVPKATPDAGRPAVPPKVSPPMPAPAYGAPPPLK